MEEVFAIGITLSTGLRNRLVHEYEGINNQVVYSSVEKVINTYMKYISIINRYIQDAK